MPTYETAAERADRISPIQTRQSGRLQDVDRATLESNHGFRHFNWQFRPRAIAPSPAISYGSLMNRPEHTLRAFYGFLFASALPPFMISDIPRFEFFS